MTDDELLRQACIYAEYDRQSFADAYSKDPNNKYKKEAEAFLRQVRAYRKKRWGKTKLEILCDKAEEVDVSKIIQLYPPPASRKIL